MQAQNRTLYDKLWDMHLVAERGDGYALLYIDRHLVHEVTSPQAFEGLRLNGRKPWRIDSILATADHNVPTTSRAKGIDGITDNISKIQVQTLDDNCKLYGIKELGIDSQEQGIVHTIGPELGASLPGMTIVCGDSHTATHGALGTLSYGIGTSEVEHVLATQCLIARKSKNMFIQVDKQLNKGVFAKDIILAIIGKIGTAGGTGYTIEYGGEVIRSLSMEGRMTICNMSIEAGARAGLIATDQTTIDYVKGRRYAPKDEMWKKAQEFWLKKLHSDEGAKFDTVIEINGAEIAPQVTWGTSPEMVTSIEGKVPNPDDADNAAKQNDWKRALEYMGLKPGTAMHDINLDRIFIGSCTNSRIEDLRVAADIVKGNKVASSIKEALVVPSSGMVKKQAEEEGLDKIFQEAGFQWRSPGCSMCLGMNPDQLSPQEHCAATSNRNFEGRQGTGGRTHLVSPAMAALAAIRGRFNDVREVI